MSKDIKAAIARGFHLFPSRTEQLSPAAPMVLPAKWESRSPPFFKWNLGARRRVISPVRPLSFFLCLSRHFPCPSSILFGISSIFRTHSPLFFGPAGDPQLAVPPHFLSILIRNSKMGKNHAEVVLERAFFPSFLLLPSINGRLMLSYAGRIFMLKRARCSVFPVSLLVLLHFPYLMYLFYCHICISLVFLLPFYGSSSSLVSSFLSP